jgi:hypothetical protein
MAKITYTADDGSTQDFNDQAYTDAAVAAAVAAATPAPGPVVSSLTDTSVVIQHSDGSSQTFVVEIPAAEAAEVAPDAPAA